MRGMTSEAGAPIGNRRAEKKEHEHIVMHTLFHSLLSKPTLSALMDKTANYGNKAWHSTLMLTMVIIPIILFKAD